MRVGTGTWEGHQHVAVLRGHSLHPRLVGHQVPTRLQEPLPKKLIWGGRPSRPRSGHFWTRSLASSPCPCSHTHQGSWALSLAFKAQQALDLACFLQVLAPAEPSSRNALPPDPLLQILLILEAQIRLQHHNGWGSLLAALSASPYYVNESSQLGVILTPISQVGKPRSKAFKSRAQGHTAELGFEPRTV